MTKRALVEVQDLAIRFPDEPQPALRPVSFAVYPGETVGIQSPSGTGKTLVASAIAGFIPEEAIVSGTIAYYLDDAPFHYNPSHYQILPLHIRRQLAMVFQAPQQALNPLITCGAQVAECLTDTSGTRERREHVLDLFRQVKLKEPSRIYQALPHRLSGGQQQRVLLAIALAQKARLLIADEITTALDPVVTKEILDLIKSVKSLYKLSLVWVSHDSDVLRYMDARIINLTQQASIQPKEPDIRITNQTVPRQAKPPLLTVSALTKSYGTGARRKQVLRDINLSLYPGDTIGIMGRTGSGKSTLAQLIAGILPPDEGTISSTCPPARIQMVFQNAPASLVPPLPVLTAVADIVRYNIHGDNPAAVAKTLLRRMGLDDDLLYRLPGELSGGQQQRVAIAKALAANPRILLLDEATTGLEKPVAYDILSHLLRVFTGERALVIISHEPAIIRRFTTRCIVLDDGQIVEQGPTDRLFQAPKSPRLQTLLQAARHLST